ncbi:MAG: ABC transporter ATP-binding protein [Fimbriimonas ginsengisoli]|uniref:ABC transporter ATP-binding protein n=1 Tax=Fimbriimonas ginsengisoli TaxID=1005039 RepID=A0A931LS94_FIMGI|nr:ABC transporter ATP-binding protein [Fimbriimonas ginsengisoli]
MSTAGPAIRVKDLHKEFLLSHSGIASLKSLVLQWKRPSLEHLHVLRGISFEVAHSECVGIVGRNGAGKSTLLSLMARIYKPTSGSVEISGRVAPLLELGAGFHVDLTGLENIFVNGMILGISRKELEKRLDAIVEFSELYNHIDSPVRTYSSGMNARLGFAIAVHVDADVLLVDEVLAVGDYEFREKCQRKIDDLKAEGRTIVMVSHSGDDVERLSDRCIWLQNGRIEREGDPKEVLEAYVTESTNELASQREEAMTPTNEAECEAGPTS